MTQWEFYTEAMRGGKPETTPGHPHSGFFRDRSTRAVAIWWDGDDCKCLVTSGFQPKHIDEIDELFGYVCRAPISRDLFMQIQASGVWPEDIETTERGIGDNSQNLDPHEAIESEINNLVESARAWLEVIGGKVTTQEQADKAANYATAFGNLEKKADEARVAEKKPIDEQAKAVQTKWKPIVDKAAEKKTWLKKAFEAFAIAEKRRREEEARKEREEYERKLEEQRKAAEAQMQSGIGDFGEVSIVEPPPPPEPIKNVSAGTRGKVALKTRTDYVIVDLPAFAAYVAAMQDPPSDFLEGCRKVAARMGAAGVTPPGVEKKLTEYAA